MPLLRAAALLWLAGLAVPALSDSQAAGAVDDMPQVALETTLGTIVVELDAERAPVTVENFLRYVEDDFYDGTIFHRVIEGFMIQGGGFNARFARKSTREAIRNEANNGLSNRRYTIAMARTNAPHSATAQFFINTADNTNLDHVNQTQRGWGYTVFGEVIDGQQVVEAISQVATGAGGPFSRDTPREPVVIESATRIGESDPAGPVAGEAEDKTPAEPGEDDSLEPAAASPDASNN